MDINQLEVLVAIAKERSFSRAAVLLGRTQPAVSQSISRLERELGETLFDRSSKDGTLTASGEILLEHARQIINLRQNAASAIKELHNLKFGKLTLSANEHTVFAILPIISKFQESHPNVKVEVRRGVASRIPEEIILREVELGVLSFNPKDDALHSVGIGSDDLVLIAPTKHAFAKRQSVRLSELASQRFIAHNARSPYRQLVIETFEKHKTKLNIVVELPSLEAIKRMVESGAGVALVPRLTAAAEIKTGILAGIRVQELQMRRDLNIVYRKNAVLSHAANEFLSIASEK
ncbi:MAG: LysR substrate-binding domain-containing protein [Pyrinomonadaceae bacterium]